MSYAKEFTGLANAVSGQINPVDVKTWAILPAFIGLLFCCIIIIIWQPKFSGTYKYLDCSNARKVDGKVVDTNDCTSKTGSVFKRNLVIILLLVLILPGIFAGLGYKLGFYIANPKIGAGIFGTGLLVDSFKR